MRSSLRAFRDSRAHSRTVSDMLGLCVHCIALPTHFLLIPAFGLLILKIKTTNHQNPLLVIASLACNPLQQQIRYQQQVKKA
jgi:hypothetical protein